MKMTRKKIEYHKATFILSVIGFIGSIGFYVGVLRQVYGDDDDKLKKLESENRELKREIEELKTISVCHE